MTVDTVSGGLVEAGDASGMRPDHRKIVETLKPVVGPHILTGPITVRGTEPGDTLEVAVARTVRYLALVGQSDFYRHLTVPARLNTVAP